MRRQIIVLLLVAACGVVLSCGSAKGAAGAKLNPVYVTDKATFQLLPTALREKDIDAVQHITATFGARAFESDCLLIADGDVLSLTMLNEFGTTVGELNYNNDLVVFNTALFPSAVKAEYIVADVQFCLYRADALQAALEAIGLRLEVSAADGGETRAIFDGERKIIHIEKSAGTIAYTNVLRGYSYLLQGAF